MNSQLLLNWNLLVLLTDPFIKFNQNQPKQLISIDFKNSLMKVDNFLMLIPDILKINDFSFDISKNKSINVFSIQEIEKINQIIMLLKEELSKFTYELMKGISSDTINEFIDGKVPLSSCKMTYVWNYVSINSFPSHVIKLHSQLTRVISEKNHISFDLRFIIINF